MAFYDFLPSSLESIFPSASNLSGMINDSMPSLGLGTGGFGSNAMQVPTDLLRSSYKTGAPLNLSPTVQAGIQDAEPGLFSKLGSGMKTASEYAGPVANLLGGLGMASSIPLGIMSMETAKKGQEAMQQGVNTAERMAAPAIASEEQLMPAGTSALMTGQLPPELQTQVDNQVNQYEQSMIQNLVSQGINPDTARSMIAGQVQQMRNQLTMQSAQSLLGGGQGVAGIAGEGSQIGGSQGSNLYGTSTNALYNSQNSLSRLLGSA